MELFMVKPEDLNPFPSSTGRIKGKIVTVTSHGAFLEAGYNYLAALRDSESKGALDERKVDFANELRADIKAQGLNVGPQEFAQFARDTLSKIAKDFGLPEPASRSR
jgi:hypothetical protein